ncbi:MAG: 3-isopropylmalate dehydratase small subunit [Anaerolineae bacterium]
MWKSVHTGRVWKYGDDVNTDVIYPGKYTYSDLSPEEMAEHALEDLDPEFASHVEPGDIIVAGTNFGCGSSREQAVTCLQYAGVGVLIAKSFARIYFRNAINQGLPIVQCAAVEGVESGEEVAVDFSTGKVVTPRGEYSFPPLSSFVMGILQDGGLIPHVRRKLGIE